MPRTLRSDNRKTKTTRCSCCDNDNNRSKESSHRLSNRKNAVPRNSLKAVPNEEKKKSHAETIIINEKNKKVLEGVKNNKIIKSGGRKQNGQTKSSAQVTRGKENKIGRSKPVTVTKVSKAPANVSQDSISRKKITSRKPLAQTGSSLNTVESKTKSKKTGIKSLTDKKLKGCTVILKQVTMEDFKHIHANGEKQIKNGHKTVTKNLKPSNNAKTSPKTHPQTSVPSRKLRSRKPIEYADSSLEATTCDKKVNVKVPIYKQNVDDKNPTKRKGDQYEFDSDTEKHKKGKRRKLDDSSSDPFNKTFQEILKNIAEKSMKKKKKVIFSDANKKKKATKQKLHNNRTISNNNQLKSKTDRVVNQEKTKGTLTKLTSPKNFAIKFANKQQVSNTNLTSTPKINVNLSNKNKKGVLNVEDLSQEKDLLNLSNATIYSDSEDEYFVADTNESAASPKVQILSNIQLKPRKELNWSIASPKLFKDGQPNANSTLLNNVLTPWRFNDINIKRNPHFIAIKPSSLPYLNQEMVLDHSIVDKLNDTSKIEVENVQENRRNNTKSLLQTTLNDYLKCNNENKENEENTKVSLFDNDQFSPIKNDKRISHKQYTGKRRILGEINENLMEQPRSVQNLEESTNLRKIDEDDAYFGFDSVEEEDEENVPVLKKDDKPFRVSINLHDKKYQRKKKFNIRKKNITIESDKESSASDDSDTESDKGQLKLFEDFNDTQEQFEQQQVKTGIVNKLRNNKDLPNQKKRKDVRSKEEEEQAEQWAAAFNSMCEEIEQFPLEIE